MPTTPPDSDPTNDPATQTPAYQALAAVCSRMIDAVCDQNASRQRAAAAEMVALIGDDIRPDEILDTLRIKSKDRRPSAGRRWVSGTIARHAFEALVFEEHAENPEYEMDGSRISKFWLKDQLTDQIVCEFDRGWGTKPTTEAATNITSLLAEGLADLVFDR